jgi:SAM-dependent methyltransferase
MTDPTAVIRDDFDRLAPLYGDGWSHNAHYHAYLLRHLPDPCRTALDIGCGIGTFARQLARRADHVTGIDLSPAMLDRARQESADVPNLTYQVADVMALDLPPESYDCIASIAALHHVPLADVLPRLQSALRPGGVLLVLDLYEPSTWRDRLLDVLASPVHLALQIRHHGLTRQPAAAVEAWRMHGAHDSFLTMAQVRQVYGRILPGARIRQHLLWRYSVVWYK